MNQLLINLDEIFLKGKNAGNYRKLLNDQLRALMSSLHPYPFQYKKCECNYLFSSEKSFSSVCRDRLAMIPGVQSVDTVFVLDREMNQLYDKILGRLPTEKPFSFKFEVKRIDKKFEMRSMDLKKALGGFVLDAFPLSKVELANPEHLFFLKIYADKFVLRIDRYLGVGGVPVGSSGRALCLLSGGIDSPVAAHLMAKRGLALDFVFFHSYPYVSYDVVGKIKDLVSRLAMSLPGCRLYLVPIGAVQKKIAQEGRLSYRTLFLRRAMLELSEVLAHKLNSSIGALITGDCLGQVSSQTLGNMSLVDSCVGMPILRPLIGFNKQEIIGKARQMKTIEISLRTQDDACSLFAPQNPVINPSVGVFEHSRWEFQDIYQKLIDDVHVFEFDINGRISREFCGWNPEDQQDPLAFSKLPSHLDREVFVHQAPLNH